MAHDKAVHCGKGVFQPKSLCGINGSQTADSNATHRDGAVRQKGVTARGCVLMVQPAKSEYMPHTCNYVDVFIQRAELICQNCLRRDTLAKHGNNVSLFVQPPVVAMLIGFFHSLTSEGK